MFSLDVNECEDGRHNCDPQSAKCVNTIGSFYCACKDGFSPMLGGNSFAAQVAVVTGTVVCEGIIYFFHILFKWLFHISKFWP